MKEDLEFDIEGEIFEHFMTLQNFYKISQDSLGIVQFIFLMQVVRERKKSTQNPIGRISFS